ncbi:MAG TPA: SRPBCC family protein [Stellaceae bacterium]|nr:SRPBCC family protein [Stellaceae bacterium]
MIEVEIDQHFSAPPQKVFDAVTDHKRIEEWQRGTRVSIERPGVPPPNGLGAVRKITGGPLRVYEEVVRWEAPHAMDYRLIRGAPLRDHLGELRFTPTPEGGTLLEYRIRYHLPWWAGGAVVGRLFGRQLERVIGGAMKRLARDLR